MYSFSDLKETIQEDLLTLLDGQDQDLLDKVCQVVVDRVNQLAENCDLVQLFD